MYISFIRPILEYGDVVWDNYTQQEKQDIEKIQIEAARIVTGTTKLVSINSLYKETGWETLETRRKNHKFTLFFKIINDLAPQYLSDLVPATIDSSLIYNLRNSNNIHLVNVRTSLYFNSFLPSAVRDWNNIPDDRRNVESVIAFKNVLSRDKPIVPRHYPFGNKKEQILHTRLRTNCSVLNYDLYLKNILYSPLCRCNNIETVKQFFLDCPNYNNQRITLMQTVSRFCAITLDTLLYGNSTLSLHAIIVTSLKQYNSFWKTNKQILVQVQIRHRKCPSSNIMCKYVTGSLDAYGYM